MKCIETKALKDYRGISIVCHTTECVQLKIYSKYKKDKMILFAKNLFWNNGPTNLDIFNIDFNNVKVIIHALKIRPRAREKRQIYIGAEFCHRDYVNNHIQQIYTFNKEW